MFNLPPCLKAVNWHGDSKVAKYQWAHVLFEKFSDSSCWKGLGPPASARGALGTQRHSSHVSLWTLTTRRLVCSVPTAGASGRSLTISLSKGHWGNAGWRSPTDGKLWWDSHWWGERRGYSLFAKKLCGWLQCPSDDFHCECSLTLVVSVFGRKTTPDTEHHSLVKTHCPSVFSRSDFTEFWWDSSYLK